MSKVTCELRALEPGPGSANADGGPAGAAGTKCCGLSAGEANAGTVLIEESAATLTQFLLAGLVLQSSEEANGPLVSQEVQEAHKFAVEAAGCRHNQGEKGLVVMTEVVRAICVALRLRHGRVPRPCRRAPCQVWSGEADRDGRGQRHCRESRERGRRR